MNKELGLKYEPYEKIGINEIMERSKILDQNPNFANSISSILDDLAREKQESNQTELLFEETIYAGGFVSPKDKDNMTKFHDVDLKGKLSLNFRILNILDKVGIKIMKMRLLKDQRFSSTLWINYIKE